jgi:hypothetical protein
MNHRNDIVDRVRSLMGPGNPVPGDSSADGWRGPRACELQAWIMAQADPAAGPPVPSGRPAGRPERDRRVRLLAPLAAGLAVAVIAGLVLAAGSAPHQRSAAGPPAAGNIAGTGGAPAFYVALRLQAWDRNIAVFAQARSSQTGQILSSRRIGYYGDGMGIAAAGPGDRSFVIYAGDNDDNHRYAERLWRLNLSSDGTSMRVRELPLVLLPPGSDDVVDGIAVSPDGTRLAVALQLADALSATMLNPRMEMLVYSLTGGATQTWTAPDDLAVAWNPQWTSSSDLTFVWQDRLTGTPDWFTGASQVRVLDTSKPGRDLLNSAVIATGGGSTGFIQSAAYGPLDAPVVGATYRDEPAAGGSGHATLRLVGLTPAGISKVYVSSRVSFDSRAQMEHLDNSCQVLAADATGQHLLVSCPGFGRIDHGKFTALPGNSGIENAAW